MFLFTIPYLYKRKYPFTINTQNRNNVVYEHSEWKTGCLSAFPVMSKRRHFVNNSYSWPFDGYNDSEKTYKNNDY